MQFPFNELTESPLIVRPYLQSTLILHYTRLLYEFSVQRAELIMTLKPLQRILRRIGRADLNAIVCSGAPQLQKSQQVDLEVGSYRHCYRCINDRGQSFSHAKRLGNEIRRVVQFRRDQLFNYVVLFIQYGKLGTSPERIPY